MTAADVDRRMGAVDAGLQWAWAASQQVRRFLAPRGDDGWRGVDR